MLKASHLNQVYALEELVYRKYPEEITRLTERIAGYGQDVALAAAHPKAQEGFCGMEVDGKHYAEKEDAGRLHPHDWFRRCSFGAVPGLFHGAGL